MANQYIVPGFPFGTWINETGTTGEMVPGAWVTENSSSASYTIDFGTNSLAITPEAVTLAATRQVTFAQASLTITPEPVTLVATRQLSFAQGTLTITPEAMTIAAARKIAFSQAALSLSPQAVSITATRRITFAQGALTLAPKAVSLLANRKLTFSQGTLTLTPETMTLVAVTGTHTFNIGSATLAITPGFLNIRANRALSIGPATLTLTAGNAVLRKFTPQPAPATTATRLEVPLLALIKRRDPTFFKDRARVTEYEMSNGREFKADPTTRGAYGAPNSGPAGGGYADTSTRVELPTFATGGSDPNVVEYEFAGRTFSGNTSSRGAYADYTGPVGADDFFSDSTPDVFNPNP